MNLLIQYDSSMHIYSSSPLLYYVRPWRRIVVALLTKRLPRNETAEDMGRFCTTESLPRNETAVDIGRFCTTESVLVSNKTRDREKRRQKRIIRTK